MISTTRELVLTENNIVGNVFQHIKNIFPKQYSAVKYSSNKIRCQNNIFQRDNFQTHTFPKQILLRPFIFPNRKLSNKIFYEPNTFQKYSFQLNIFQLNISARFKTVLNYFHYTSVVAFWSAKMLRSLHMRPFYGSESLTDGTSENQCVCLVTTSYSKLLRSKFYEKKLQIFEGLPIALEIHDLPI